MFWRFFTACVERIQRLGRGMISAVVFRPVEWSQFIHSTAVPSLPSSEKSIASRDHRPNCGDKSSQGKRYADHDSEEAGKIEKLQLTKLRFSITTLN